MKILLFLALIGLGAAATAVSQDGKLQVAESTITTTSISTSLSKFTSTLSQTSTTPAATTTETTIVTSTKTTSAASTTPTPNDEDVSLDADLDDFLTLSLYSQLAHDAPTPFPYTLIFTDYNATAIHQPIQTRTLPSYNADECAIRCNGHLACRSFSIYIERQLSCTDCTDPESVVANMCELYNTPLERRIVADGGGEQRVNGQKFTRAVRAANGYNRAGKTVTVTSTITRTSTASADASTVWRTSDVTATVTVTTTTTATTTATTTVAPTPTPGSPSTTSEPTSTSTSASESESTSEDPRPPITKTLSPTDLHKPWFETLPRASEVWVRGPKTMRTMTMMRV
ncbi:hypothetical protein EKO04_006494 [Ascochyta lentis]|uniref:Apple domain-containing protein n=1 Tax=Ascochyta lentis TaxID=205686 RepID=A0A8H7J2L7_9PLEO|nr:hypothetical protein EKO04_006494 [Ascochyta lentis]